MNSLSEAPPRSLLNLPITFRSNPSRITAILAYMSSSINQPKWDLSQGRYKLWGFQQQVLQNNIISTTVQQLSLKNNQIDMIKEIVSINFVLMREMNLDGNSIASIQALATLEAPHLENISLNSNNINEIKALRKCNFRKLKQISIRQNNIRELGYLTEAHFPALEVIFLESALNQKVQCDNLAPFVKLQSQDMKWIFIAGSRRLKQFANILKNKWPESEIKGKVGLRRFNIVNNNYSW